jgi:hypothetical protein
VEDVIRDWVYWETLLRVLKRRWLICERTSKEYKMSTLDELAREAYLNSKLKGFHERDFITNGNFGIRNPSIDGERLALIHSEISECLDSLRDGNDEGAEEELADVIIRVLDFSESKGWSMDKAVANKMAKNKHRERLHGKKW